MPRDFPKRDMEARLFRDENIQTLIAEEDIRLIHWRKLRDYQRSTL
jgi:hypothetical protein